jgi:hypothetical protein
MTKTRVWRSLTPRPLWPFMFCALSILLPLQAGEKPEADPPAEAAATTSSSEMEQLKRMLLDQQRQIDELRRALADKNAPAVPALVPKETNTATLPSTPVIEHVSTGEVASTRPVVPPAPSPTPAPFGPLPSVPPPAPQATADNNATSPLQFKLGDAYFTPVGFMDMTSVTRSTNPGTGIGTNFGSIPYSNTQAGSLTETRLSPQNSRIGMRVDAATRGFNVMGYWESDFLGQLGVPPNGGLAVSSNPYVFRLRLYWVDVMKNKFEFLAGQSWSLMTPNRRGISPLPADVFYSQDMDVNYQLGLTWARNPGFRLGYHFSDKAAFALALENSEPYVGGANGGSAITGPSAIYGTPNTVSGAVLGGQINNGDSGISAAALHPDIIAKLALDPSSKFHIELVGLETTAKISDPVSVPAFQTNSKVGGGGALNFNFELFKGFRIFDNNYYSSGGGRYIFGEAPDFMIRANGTISLIHSASTVAGFEANAGKTLVYGYYGGVYIDKNLALDANGKTLIGYGPISNDGQNRDIQEFTIGTNTTLARDPKWGALNLITQYSYVVRDPWLATSAPTSANASMGFFDLRYTLPGSAPTIGH